MQQQQQQQQQDNETTPLSGSSVVTLPVVAEIADVPTTACSGTTPLSGEVVPSAVATVAPTAAGLHCTTGVGALKEHEQETKALFLSALASSITDDKAKELLEIELDGMRQKINSGKLQMMANFLDLMKKYDIVNANDVQYVREEFQKMH